MSYGLQIISSNGFIQIDQNYANYYLIHRGFASVPARTASNIPGVTATWATQPSPCLVFVRPPYGRYVANTVSISANEPFLDSASIFNTGVIGTPAFSVEYAVFAPRSNAGPNTGHGFQVFMPNGQVAFSSLDTHLRIVAGQTYTYGGLDFSVTLPSAPGNAFFMLNGIGWFENYRESSIISDTNGFAGALTTESQFRMEGWSNPGAPNNATRVGTMASTLIARIL